MTRLIAAAIAILCLLFTTSTASFAKPQAEYIPCGNYLHLCAKDWKYDLRKGKRATKHRSSFRVSHRRVYAKPAHLRKAQARSHRHARVARPAATVSRGAAEARQPQAARLSGVVAPLAAKAVEIVKECGARVVSGVRRTFIAGTRQMSLHASGRAVDMVGNYGCIYARLAGWPGGYSVDAKRVRHVHISWSPGGREWGTRFVHNRHTRRSRIGG